MLTTNDNQMHTLPQASQVNGSGTCSIHTCTLLYLPAPTLYLTGTKRYRGTLMGTPDVTGHSDGAHDVL